MKTSKGLGKKVFKKCSMELHNKVYKKCLRKEQQGTGKGYMQEMYQKTKQEMYQKTKQETM